MNFRVKLGKVQRWELPSPALVVEVLPAKAVDVCLQTGFKIVKDCGTV